MRATLLAAATTVLLAASLAPAVADPEDRSLADAAATAQDEAEQALAEVEALVEATPADAPAEAEEAHPTMALTELVRTRGELTGADRKRANRLLARPTATGGDGLLDYNGAPTDSFCDDVICIHWVTDGSNDDAPDLTDDTGEPVPDSVEQALATAREVHDAFVGSGYRRPDPDGDRGADTPADPSDDDKVDIYLGNLGGRGYYGYCTTDQPQKNDGTYNYWAYCAIDDDFAEFPQHTPLENQQVTLAHEYFHAVQYAYDAAEDGWFLEATAAWVEDELFDDVDDNRQYLPEGQLQRPRIPLDEYDFGELAHYGQWLFFRHLTERFPDRTGSLPTIVLDMWRSVRARQAGDPDLYSTLAVHQALTARGASFTEAYADFAVANRTPGRSYEEGAAYEKAAPTKRFGLGRGNKRTGQKRVFLDHLTHAIVRYRPRADARGPWRLKVKLDMPHRRTAPVARLVAVKKGGNVVERSVSLTRRGVGRKTIGFNGRRVKYVELVLVNASRRTDCWTGGGSAEYACLGSPQDDFRRTTYAAKVFRR